MVRVTVLKSLRTHSGAEDWLRIMGKQFEGAKIMDTETLKAFPDVAYTVDPTGFASHIVLEEDLSPVIERIKEGDLGKLLAALMDKGYVTIDNYGVCFTEKWNSAISEFMSKVFEDGINSYKSTATLSAPAEFTAFLEAGNRILKALDADSTASAEAIPSAPESDVSADCEDPEAVSDAEAKAAMQEGHTAPAVPDVADKLDSEAVSGEHAVKGITFKSLPEARAWDNPDSTKYYVDTMTFKEKNKYGVRYSYIVREREPKNPIGALGNRRVSR